MDKNEVTETQGGADARDCVPRLVRQGWRFFHCEACEHRWKEASRDWRSPSGANCPRCGEWWFPYHGEADASLSVDNMGNLVPNVELRHPTYD